MPTESKPTGQSRLKDFSTLGPISVVLDTTCMHEDFELRNASLQAVLSARKTLDWQFMVPRVVTEELINQYRESLFQSLQQLSSAGSRLQRLLQQRKPVAGLKLDSEAEVDKYRKRLLDRLSHLGVRVLEYPTVSHESTVARDLARMKPFSKEGKGYRDWLNWNSVLAWIKKNRLPAVFVTANSKDFCGSTGVHDDLVGDLRAIKFDPNRFAIAADLNTLFSECISPSLAHPTLFTPVDVRWPMCCRLGNFGSAKPVGPLAFLFVRPS